MTQQTLRVPVGSKRDAQVDHNEMYEETRRRNCNCIINCKLQFSVEEISQIRTTFLLNKSYEQIFNKCIEYVSLSIGKKGGKRVWTLLGKKICRVSFCQLVGICNDSLIKVTNKLDKPQQEKTQQVITNLPSTRNLSCQQYLQDIFDKAQFSPSNANEKVLPSFINDQTHFYRLYYDNTLNNGKKPLSRRRFISIWETEYPLLKLNTSTMMRCGICASFDTELTELQAKLENTSEAKEEIRNQMEQVLNNKENHIQLAMDHREAYMEDIQYCLKHHIAHLSIDGSMHLELPIFRQMPHHLQMKPKLNTYLYGIVNDAMDHVMNFVYTKEIGSSGKSVDDVISCLIIYLNHINYLDYTGTKPKDLYIQADNTTRENKNYFLLSLLHYLVCKGMLGTVMLKFMITGHTKFSADANFGIEKTKLRKEHQIGSIQELQSRMTSIQKTYHKSVQGLPKKECKELIRALTWREELQKYYEPLKDITKFQIFEITKAGIRTKHSCKETDWQGPFHILKSGIDIKQIVLQPSLYEYTTIDDSIINNIPDILRALDPSESRTEFWTNIQEGKFRYSGVAEKYNYGYPQAIVGSLIWENENNKEQTIQISPLMKSSQESQIEAYTTPVVSISESNSTTLATSSKKTDTKKRKYDEVAKVSESRQYKSIIANQTLPPRKKTKFAASIIKKAT